MDCETWFGQCLLFTSKTIALMAAQKKSNSTRSTKQRSRQARRGGVMVFAKRNYILLVVGLVMIVVGYVIMRMENEVDGFISLYVAPLLLLAGYLEIIYAIIWRPAKEEPAGQAPTT